MRSIAVVGAGQAGLLLACALRKCGYQVSLFTDRTAQQIYDGRITSSQGIFKTALSIEKHWGLNFWDDECPKNLSVNFTLAQPGHSQKAIEWNGKVNAPFQSVDQRLKFSRLITEFEHLGGNLVISEITTDSLDKIANSFDLTIVSSGKGALSKIFSRDEERSCFKEPMRKLACLYVTGMKPILNFPGVRANIIPGVGEYFTMPGLTLSGTSEMMLFEAIPDSSFDSWNIHTNPEDQLNNAKSLLQSYIPWEAERCEDIKLTDIQAVLTGSYTPEIKHSIAVTKSGKQVLGIADALVLNDPIAGQGANNAIKFADIYINRILKQANKPFDHGWMLETFEEAWEKSGKWSTLWSNMLLQPPPPHIISLLAAASEIPSIANKIANGFDNPASLFPWIEQPDTTLNMIQEAKMAQVT